MMEIDLNQPVQQEIEDPREVILNPARPVIVEDLLELNDLIDNPIEEIQVDLQEEQQDNLNPQEVEQSLLLLTDQELQSVELNNENEVFWP